MSDRPRETAVPLVHYRPVRSLVLQLRQAEALARRSQARLEQAQTAYAEAVAAITEPLGVPADLGPMQLEVLARIAVDGEHWIWTGQNNNKGTATVRRWEGHRSEVSAVRVVHEAVAGDHAPPGAMQPRCALGQECVRPAHRCPTCQALAQQ